MLSFVKQSFYDKSAWRNEHQEGDGEEGTGKVFDEAAFRQEAQQCVKESLQSINHPKDDGRSTRARTHTHTSAQTHTLLVVVCLQYCTVNPSDSETLHS